MAPRPSELLAEGPERGAPAPALDLTAKHRVALRSHPPAEPPRRAASRPAQDHWLRRSITETATASPMPSNPGDPQAVLRAARDWREVDGWWRWKNFGPGEFACKGSSLVYVDPELLDRLEALRRELGDTPLLITSGFRSPRHNRRVGGDPESQHMLGRAVDLVMLNQDPKRVAEAARRVGFRGIGHYPKQNFMHLDIRAYSVMGNDFAAGEVDEFTRPRGAVWASRHGRFDREAEGARARVDESAGTAGRGAATVGVGTTAAGGAAYARDAGFSYIDVINAVAQVGGIALLMLVGWQIWLRRAVISAKIADWWGPE